MCLFLVCGFVCLGGACAERVSVFACASAIGVLWVRACSSPPFLFAACFRRVFWGVCVGAWGLVCRVFCVKGVVDCGCEVACEW